MQSTPTTDERRAKPTGRLAALGDLAYRRRGRVVVAWIVGLVAILALTPALAGEFDADFGTPGSESEQASALVSERFPGQSGDTIDVVWQDRAGVDRPATEQRMERFLTGASKLEGIAEPAGTRVSPDGTVAVARLELDRRAWNVPLETGEELIERAEATSGGGLRVELGGQIVQEAEGGASPESAGLLSAALILLIAFGSVVAAGLPILIALFGLGISSALIGVLAAVMDVPDFAPAVAGLIGIGVGIDYALLVVTRFRAALADGEDTRAAIGEAVGTAGRSVLVAGSTVVVSMLGLFLVGAAFLRGVAVSASLAVLIVMAASITLLPAVLSYAGPRVNKLRLPFLGRERKPGRSTPAERWSRVVQRRPWAAALAGAAILLALTAPVAGLRLGFPDAGNAREGTTTREAYDISSRAFGPGSNGPLLLAADLGDPGSGLADVQRVAQAARADSDVAFVVPPQINEAGDAAVLTVIPRSAPQDPETADLVERLRERVIPGALGESATAVSVGGMSASVIDQSESLAGRLPLFVGGVVGLSFLLLLVAFRSPLIALKAGVMNLLSVGAAYGVVALVAQGGFAGGLFGIDTEVPVPPFIPVMMFAILFGLSMDYEVFLLSRVREQFLGRMASIGARANDDRAALLSQETSRAVTEGLAKTARVITAAAAIMVCVFLAFVLSPEVFLKLMGIGMATAVFVDATIVRMVLVPAVMQLMGRANWWIPGWLDRLLPRLDSKPANTPEPALEPVS